MDLELVLKLGIVAIIILLIGIYQRLGDNQKKLEEYCTGLWKKLKDIEEKI